MKMKRFLSLTCAAMLLFSLSACNERELPPYLRNPETTAPTTSASTTVPTTATTTTTTRMRTTTTTAITVMSLEEYLSQDRAPKDKSQQEYYKKAVNWRDGPLIREPGQRVFVYFEKFEYVRGEYTPDDLVKGNVYLITNQYEFVLLKDSRAATGSGRPVANYYDHFHIALDNSIYRFRHDGAEKEILTFDQPIYAVSADAYAIYFLTEEGVYRLFLPTGQVDRLSDLPVAGNNEYYRVSIFSNYTLSVDLLAVDGTMQRYYYCPMYDRWLDYKQMNALYQEETGANGWDDISPWLQEYCEKNPA